MKFNSLISQIGKPVNTSEALLGRSSRWIASKFGVSMRTAQRWRKGTQAPKPERAEKVMKSADAEQRRKVAAEALRSTQAIQAGRVLVVDKSPRGKGKKARANYRPIGVIRVDPVTRARLDHAADLLERGEMREAEAAMKDAILHSPGKDYGSALDIEDWPPGFNLI